MLTHANKFDILSSSIKNENMLVSITLIYTKEV